MQLRFTGELKRPFWFILSTMFGIVLTTTTSLSRMPSPPSSNPSKPPAWSWFPTSPKTKLLRKEQEEEEPPPIPPGPRIACLKVSTVSFAETVSSGSTTRSICKSHRKNVLFFKLLALSGGGVAVVVWLWVVTISGGFFLCLCNHRIFCKNWRRSREKKR